MIYSKKRTLSAFTWYWVKVRRCVGPALRFGVDDSFRSRLQQYKHTYASLPLNIQGIIGSRELDLLKPTSYIINTSRGPLIDEPSLIRILQDHKLAGAGLDVFDLEPLPKDHPFKKLDNVVLSPHMGPLSIPNLLRSA